MEAPTFLNTIIALFVLGLFRDASMQSDCGFYIEEGIRWLLTCGTRTAQFTSFGPRVEIDGQILDVGHCDSDGNCISPYPSNFGVTSGTNETTGRKEVTVTIYSVNRTMTRTHCYRDGIPINGVECLLNIYVKASKPTCEGPQIVDGNTAALFICTSERVDPAAMCYFELREGSLTAAQRQQLLMHNTTNSDSAQFPGDKEVTCQLRIQIVGIPENLYRFRPVLFPENAPNIASAITYGDTMPPLSLWRTVLSDEAENDRVFNFPESDELLVTIPVTVNPQPNRFSLNVRYTNTSAPSPMPDEDYSAIFNPSTSNSRGVITLTISAGLKRDQTSRFSFKADNGVVGRSALEYNFSVLKLYSIPTEPSCASPEFVDEGTAVLFSCTADRIFPRGRCEFTLMDGKNISEQRLQQTTSHDMSFRFPGEQKVTCQLHLSVTDVPGGSYRFQVEVSPDLPGVQASDIIVTSPLPTLSLLECHGQLHE